MILRSLISGLAAATALALAAGSAGAACQFQKLAEVPVTMAGLRPTIAAKINGLDAKFMIDTGAVFSAVTPETVAKFKMKHSIAPFGATVKGVGGAQRALQAVAADTFSFSNVGFHDTDFMVVGRAGGGDVAGVIGENLMGPFDVEYDFANGAIRYFKATGCGMDANLAYWSEGMSVSRLAVIDPTNILLQAKVSAKIDGRNIRVQLDSGAALSVLNRTAAARAGIKINSEGVTSAGLTYGVYGAGLETFLAPFASFEIGGEQIKNTRLRIADITLGEADMLLGADFFLSHRILISNSQKKVYFTYNGGPVFRLDGAAQQQAKATEAPSGAPPAAVATANPPAASANEPKTGAEFARRAAALAARRDFQGAIADYGRTIELEPNEGRHYRARGMARLAARQPLLAMADLNEALKREPNDTDALMRRGELFLGMRQPEKAKADFDAAMTLAPADTGLVATAGVAYARAGMYEPGIRALDVWIAAHPKSEDLPLVLNARCYARGAWGKELDLALVDCDAALKKDKTSAVMDSRGLVLLRMGRLDEAIAQYAAAIKAQPRSAEPLYGRGLAELKKGQKAEGEADIAAAKAIRPGVEQEFKRLGLTAGESPAAKS